MVWISRRSVGWEFSPPLLPVTGIDDTILSAEQLLRMMVNREGAHSDRDDMTQLSISAPVKISLPDAGDEAYSRANTLRFSRLSYIQIFA